MKFYRNNFSSENSEILFYSIRMRCFLLELHLCAPHTAHSTHPAIVNCGHFPCKEIHAILFVILSHIHTHTQTLNN